MFLTKNTITNGLAAFALIAMAVIPAAASAATTVIDNTNWYLYDNTRDASTTLITNATPSVSTTTTSATIVSSVSSTTDIAGFDHIVSDNAARVDLYNLSTLSFGLTDFLASWDWTITDNDTSAVAGTPAEGDDTVTVNMANSAQLLLPGQTVEEDLSFEITSIEEDAGEQINRLIAYTSAWVPVAEYNYSDASFVVSTSSDMVFAVNSADFPAGTADYIFEVYTVENGADVAFDFFTGVTGFTAAVAGTPAQNAGYDNQRVYFQVTPVVATTSLQRIEYRVSNGVDDVTSYSDGIVDYVVKYLPASIADGSTHAIERDLQADFGADLATVDVLLARGNTTVANAQLTTAPIVIADTTAPVITLNGDATVNLTVGDAYPEQGATATDAVDGSVTVVITGSVDTATAGTYTVTYTATDAAGNVATTTRTVIVTAASTGGSSSSHHGGGSATGVWYYNTLITAPSFNPAPAAAPALGQVLGQSTFRFDYDMSLYKNSTHPDVKELQQRLTDEGFYTGPITGFFGPLTHSAAVAYQRAHNITPDWGYVGSITRGVLNADGEANGTQGSVLGVSTTTEEATTTGMSADQRAAIQSKIDALNQLIKDLLARLHPAKM